MINIYELGNSPSGGGASSPPTTPKAVSSPPPQQQQQLHPLPEKVTPESRQDNVAKVSDSVERKAMPVAGASVNGSAEGLFLTNGHSKEVSFIPLAADETINFTRTSNQ